MTAVSVVLSAYNSPLVVTQLESIANQTLAPSEVVLVNDSSDPAIGRLIDATVDRLRHLAPSIDFVVRHNDANLGMHASYSWALQRASSPIIAMCDHDDVWLPNKLAATAPVVELTGRAACHDVSVFYGDGAAPSLPIGERLSELSCWKNHAAFDGKTISVPLLLRRNRLSGTSLVFPAALRSHILPLPRDIFPDHWIALVAATRVGLQWDDRPLVHYRRHNGNTVALGGKVRGLRDVYAAVSNDTERRLGEAARPEFRRDVAEWAALARWRHAASTGEGRVASARSLLRCPRAVRFYLGPKGVIGDLARLALIRGKPRTGSPVVCMHTDEALQSNRE